MDLAILDLADVTVLFIDGLPIHRIGDVTLLETHGRIDVRCGEHRLIAQRPDSGVGENLVVALQSFGAATPLERLRPDATLLGVGAEHVAGRVEEILLLPGRQRCQELSIGTNLAEELGGAQQIGAESITITAAAVNSQGVPRASDRRS